MADHHDHSDYIRGEMDISEHKSTYAFFGDLTKWGSLILAVLLLFIVLLTCVPGVGLFGALPITVIAAASGYFFLRS